MNRIEINLITGEKKVIELTEQEIAKVQANKITWNNDAFNRAMSDLRSKRNKLLADTDYIVLPDSPVPSIKKSEFMTYRTALRNLTQGLDTIEKINNVAYPLKPQI
jgi:hypothetical protein